MKNLLSLLARLQAVKIHYPLKHIRDEAVMFTMTIYINESLTHAQVLDGLVAHYKAWAPNRPGGHRRS